jgi:DNA adenine methylase
LNQEEAAKFSSVDAAAFNNASLVSPLRYPGGKRRLLPYIARVIEALPNRPSIVIEPFAGGAAVSIGLLEHGHVPRIALADADPLIAAFWQTVFDPKDSVKLANRVLEAEITVEQWRRLREWSPVDRVDQAFKCLFLNRTSFSGILHTGSGPIGGYQQSGTYKINVRFPRARLAKRVIELAKLADRVAYVRCQDFTATLRNPLGGTGLKQLGRTFWYLDPPFWNKADKLYSCHFRNEDHQLLAREVKMLRGSWVVSYDNHPEVIALYADADHVDHVCLRYTARSRSKNDKAREALFSNTNALRGIEGKSVAVFESKVSSDHVSVERGDRAEKLAALVRRIAQAR